MLINYKLKTENIFDVDSRVAEVNEIREWLDEVTEWADHVYEIKFHSSGSRITIWFDDPEHAILFKLSWL